MEIDINLINEAAERLKDVIKKTPLEYSKRLSEKFKCNVYLKREDLQEVRSFKIRGAYNKIAALTQKERIKGVVCVSAGNHAQGVAYACKQMKVKGVVFMPVVTPNQKVNKVKKFGDGYTEIRLEGDTFDDAAKAAKVYCEKHKMVFVHPFDDELVIAGQGTIGKELVSQVEEVVKGEIDYVLVAIGGGGLVSGIAVAMDALSKGTKVIGVESETQCSMYEALKQGKVITMPQIVTFVDGTAVKTPGTKTFKIVKELVDQVVLTADGQVATDMIELYQNEGVVAEPAGALAISGLNELKAKIAGNNIICVICGGNNDLLRYPEIMEKSLVYRGLKHYFLIEFAQKPGQLKMFLDKVLGPNDDIVLFEYIKKNNKEKGPALVGIEMVNKKDLMPLLERFNKVGLKYTKLDENSMLYQLLI